MGWRTDWKAVVSAVRDLELIGLFLEGFSPCECDDACSSKVALKSELNWLFEVEGIWSDLRGGRIACMCAL